MFYPIINQDMTDVTLGANGYYPGTQTEADGTATLD